MESLPESEARRCHLTLPATRTSVAKARQALSHFGERHRADAEKIAIGVSEAVANAVLHAYREQPSGHIDVEGRLEDDFVVVVVHDHGAGMDTARNSPGLRMGLSLMSAVAERVSIKSSDSGVRVEMAFRTTP